MAVIVINSRTSNSATVALRGRVAMFVDQHIGAGGSARHSVATVLARAAWMHRPLLHDEGSTAHSLES